MTGNQELFLLVSFLNISQHFLYRIILFSPYHFHFLLHLEHCITLLVWQGLLDFIAWNKLLIQPGKSIFELNRQNGFILSLLTGFRL
jgi:hypothetical protein